MPANEIPGRRLVEPVPAFSDGQLAVLRGAGDRVDGLEPVEGGTDLVDGEDLVVPARNGAEGAGGDQTGHVVHFSQPQHAGHVVAFAVVDRPDAPHERAEIAPRHRKGDPGVAGRGEKRNRPAARVARDGDTIGIYRQVRQRPVDQAGRVPHPFADGRSPEQQVVDELVAAGVHSIGPDVFRGARFPEGPRGRRDDDVSFLGGRLPGDVALALHHMRFFRRIPGNAHVDTRMVVAVGHEDQR